MSKLEHTRGEVPGYARSYRNRPQPAAARLRLRVHLRLMKPCPYGSNSNVYFCSHVFILSSHVTQWFITYVYTENRVRLPVSVGITL